MGTPTLHKMMDIVQVHYRWPVSWCWRFLLVLSNTKHSLLSQQCKSQIAALPGFEPDTQIALYNCQSAHRNNTYLQKLNRNYFQTLSEAIIKPSQSVSAHLVGVRYSQVMAHVTQEERRKVAVHCHAGLGRTG